MGNGKRLFLLAAVIALYFNAFAKAPSWDYIWNLRFQKSEEAVFTAQDNYFYVDIKGVNPSDLTVSVNSLPQDVSFIQSKKESVFIHENEKNVSGTRVYVVLKFSTTGTFRIRPIDISVGDNFYRIPFDVIEVEENPRLTTPVITVGINNYRNKYGTGEHVIFTVYARYFSRIEELVYDIPENSIFKQYKTYDIPEFKNFSSRIYPLAEFDWQPLIAGELELPEITVRANAFNGTKCEITVPRKKITVETRTVEKKSNLRHNNPYAYAFSENIKELPAESSENITEKDIEQLYDLLQKNRHSIVPKADSIFRMPSIALFHIILMVSVFFFTCSLYFIVAGRKKMFGFLFSCFLISSIFLWIQYARVSVRYGVFNGNTVYSIPEESSASGLSLEKGSIVRIEKKAGPWRYIQYNNSYGWAKEEEILFIK